MTGVQTQITLTKELREFLLGFDNTYLFVRSYFRPGLIEFCFVEQDEKAVDYSGEAYKSWQAFANLLSCHMIKSSYPLTHSHFYSLCIRIEIKDEV